MKNIRRKEAIAMQRRIDASSEKKLHTKALSEIMPHLVATEWDFERNNELKIYPDEVSVCSSIHVFWKCKYGHSWSATVHNRTKRKKPTGCPECNKQKSFGEFSVLYYLLKRYGEEKVKSRAPLSSFISSPAYKNRKLEADIFIEPLSLVIEHNGSFHESETVRRSDEEKRAILEANGYRIITICSTKGNKTIPDCKYQYREGNITELENAAKKLLGENTDIDESTVDIRRDTMKILSLYHPRAYVPYSGEGDPRIRLAAEWDFKMNEGFTIFNFYPSSSYYAHWICRGCGHRWVALISNRAKRDCPKCKSSKAKHTIAQSFDFTKSFAYKCPDKLIQWDKEKNEREGIYPDKIYPNSKTEVYWICHSCGYRWRGSVLLMTKSRINGCKKCATESAAKSKLKPILKLDKDGLKIICRYQSILAAREDGYSHPERALDTEKLYRGFIWRSAEKYFLKFVDNSFAL